MRAPLYQTNDVIENINSRERVLWPYDWKDLVGVGCIWNVMNNY